MKALRSLWFMEVELQGWDGQQMVNETVHVSYVRYAFIRAKVKLKILAYDLKSLIGKGN
jgi:hypothetical protein